MSEGGALTVTLEGRAKDVWKAMGAPGSAALLVGGEPWRPILKALRAAVAEEREACARTAETCDLSWEESGDGVRDEIAAAIRARGRDA